MLGGLLNGAGYLRTKAVVAAFSVLISGTVAAQTFKPLYWFTDDVSPQGQVWGAMAYRDRTLYGTSLTAQGAVFQLTLPAAGGGAKSIMKVLRNFSGNDGSSPYGALTQGDNGVLYGTTTYGGPNGKMGGVFEIDP